MIVPTLRELTEKPTLSNLEILALRIAAGQSRAHVRAPKAWKRLFDLGLVDAQRQITILGRIQLSNKI